ncbi:MAG: hypothetical protein K6F75_08505 [Butyrivibrio sp.]|nr:hypothetical protein [Butyrivibrio sp.]
MIKRVVIAITGLVAAVAISAGAFINHADASSYEEIKVERVAKYNGELASKVRFEKNYAVICEPVASGSIDVAVRNIEYSEGGSTATVHLYDKNETAVYDKESHYVAYWNIYIPTNETIKNINVTWN